MSTPQFSHNSDPSTDANTPPAVEPSVEVPPSYVPTADARPVPPPPYSSISGRPVSREKSRTVPLWEPGLVLVSTFLFLAILAPRIIAYLSPLTGDEPFYLMTAISMIEDRDINECNNYRQREEARFYPETVITSRLLPNGWVGWPAAPYPLPPHAAKIVPSSRWCLGSNVQANYILPDVNTPLPADGTKNELYSKHGLGVSLLVLLPYALGDRALVVYFLNLLGALVAVNIYLLARERTGSSFVAMLTWLAFSFTVPLLSYSYLIFPELPAALMAVYAFRRIWAGRNNALQLLLAGLCVGFMPWLHYRFAPISLGLGLFFLYTLYRQKDRTIRARLYDGFVLFLPAVVAAAGLLTYFYFLYHQPFPNAADHAGVSDVAGTVRGMAGAFVDKQWGLLTVSPIYTLALFGLLLLAFRRDGRKDLLWLGIITLPYFILISNYAQWWGEWCPPARYMTAILPLMAIPFSYSLSLLSGARAAIYGFLYAALLVPSYLSSWAFIQQPQWFYNQPNQESELLTKGLRSLLRMLPTALRPDISISPALPSFVTPYFAYLRTKNLGDTWSNIAWQKSVLPFVVFGAILLGCILLAWWQSRSNTPDIDDDLSGNGHIDEPLPVRSVRRDPSETIYSPQFSLVPALAFASVGGVPLAGRVPVLSRIVYGFSAQRAGGSLPALVPDETEESESTLR